jgi:hypothetical protein
MINAAGRLIGTLSRLYGISVSTSTVKGHRDHPGQSTTCPGDNLRARIGDIISDRPLEHARRRLSCARPRAVARPERRQLPPHVRRHLRRSGVLGELPVLRRRVAQPRRVRRLLVRRGERRARLQRRCASTAPAPAPAPSAPAGASCRHTYGGRYANTACSASYQCCDGTWRTRGACGSCFCVESSGETGCGT